MSSRYRVEYYLKTHRKDEFIEWIKGLLAVPFVLHAVSSPDYSNSEDIKTASDARRRYAEVFYDVEKLIEDTILMDRQNTPEHARLRQLVPSIGHFFTKLPLEKAFYIEDGRRSISSRRLVAPSFNDIRLILNTAQVLALAQAKQRLKLVTFDGDVTLYEDGKSLSSDAPVVERLISLLKRDICVGVVTAAGYSDKSGEKYVERLKGLIDALNESTELTDDQKQSLTVMGGEANYLFRYSCSLKALRWIDHENWVLPEMAAWDEKDILATLDVAQETLTNMIKKLNLPAKVIRKHRGVGMVANDGFKLCREQLEEVVLTLQRCLDLSPAAQRIQFCAFDGGADVWCDIGAKDLGVTSLQNYYGGIGPHQTLHVGDQFAPKGSNDFKARMAGCTTWIANPQETVAVLDDLITFVDRESMFN